jgi:hypothetical protein
MIACSPEFAGIQHHHPSAKCRKVVDNLEIPKVLFCPENLFKESPERWNVPLPVSEMVYKLPFCFFFRDAKRLVESSAGRSDP